jgi:hypothetical protein
VGGGESFNSSRTAHAAYPVGRTHQQMTQTTQQRTLQRTQTLTQTSSLASSMSAIPPTSAIPVLPPPTTGALNPTQQSKVSAQVYPQRWRGRRLDEEKGDGGSASLGRGARTVRMWVGGRGGGAEEGGGSAQAALSSSHSTYLAPRRHHVFWFLFSNRGGGCVGGSVILDWCPFFRCNRRPRCASGCVSSFHPCIFLFTPLTRV